MKPIRHSHVAIIFSFLTVRTIQLQNSKAAKVSLSKQLQEHQNATRKTREHQGLTNIFILSVSQSAISSTPELEFQ